MKSKSIAAIVAVLILLALSWYLFIKDYNYKITFKTSLPPGAVYASLSNWDHLQIINSDSIIIGEVKPFEEISYTLLEKDSSFKFVYNINRTEGNETKIVTYVTDMKNGFSQNIAVPFKKNDFVNRSVSETKLFLTYLKSLEETYAVEVVEDSTFVIPSKNIAYININSRIDAKANMMATYIVYLMGYIREFDIPLDGDPFLKVNKIDLQTKMIEYEFCFPIKKMDSMPERRNIYFKETPATNAIKANFRGNYRNTEFAWYELMDYAKRNNIDVLEQPLEIYLNDPQSGTNSIDWKADVYLPIK
ncbi:GyrI-like small molecule binding domain-containing protein [Flavobacteriaceae bacterium MAR_2010_188]|nr:GyrI-like small molecule binding domain-containing protein [Flavobacteriaceae bacterium MAR_2010_188]